MPNERSKQGRFNAVVGSSERNMIHRIGWAASPADRKTQTSEHTTRLVGGEVSPIQSSDKRNDLLGRIATCANDHEVVGERLGKNPLEASRNLTCIKREFLPGDSC